MKTLDNLIDRIKSGKAQGDRLVGHLGNGFPGYDAKARHSTYQAFFKQGRRLVDANLGD